MGGRREETARGKGREGEGNGGEGGTCSKVLGGIDAPAAVCCSTNSILLDYDPKA